MGDLSAHFSKKEFACKCGCGFDSIDKKLIDKLEDLRAMLGKPIKINCGCRCMNHNEELIKQGYQASRNSQHLIGTAADIRVDGVSPSKVADVAELIGFGGIGRYRTFTHVDVRKKKSRWRG